MFNINYNFVILILTVFFLFMSYFTSLIYSIEVILKGLFKDLSFDTPFPS